MNKVIFVGVVYNNYLDTIDFLDSIKKMYISDNLVECFLVDNSDSFIIQEKIRSVEGIYSFVTVLRPSSNLGYFGAFNYFFEKYYVTPSDVIVLCNNDLVFSHDFVSVFRDKVFPEDVFVVCPDVVTNSGFHQNPHVLKPRNLVQRLKLDFYFSHYYVACFLRLFKNVLQLFLELKTPHRLVGPGYLHMGIGACYILLPSFLLRFKRLDFPHFLYGEEAYLTRQVHDASGKLYFDPNLKVLHKEGATLGKLPKRTTYEFAKKGYFSYRKFY